MKDVGIVSIDGKEAKGNGNGAQYRWKGSQGEWEWSKVLTIIITSRDY